MITSEDVEYFQKVDHSFGASAENSLGTGTGVLLWTRLTQQLEQLRGATPETLEALISYAEFLLAREGQAKQLERADERLN